MKHNFIRSFLGIGLFKVAGIPLGLIVSMVLARTLGPDQFGDYTFIMALVPMLALPTTAGLGHLITRQVARYKLEENWKLYKGLGIASNCWVLVVSTATVLGVFGFRCIYPSLMGEERWNLFLLASFLVPALGIDTVRSGFMRGLGKPVYAQFPDLLIKPITILTGLLGAHLVLEISTTIAVTIQLVAGLLSIIAASLLLTKVQPFISDNRSEYEIGSWFSSLAPLATVAIMYVMNTNIGIVLLGYLGVNEDISGMRVAERGSQIVFLSLSIMNLIIGPEIVKRYQCGDKSALQNLARSSSRGALAISIPIALVLVVFGKPLISVLYGPEYSELAYTPLVILVFGQLFNVFCGPVGNILTMSGFERKSVIAHVLAIVTNSALCFVLIPSYGAVGAAIATTVSIVIWNTTLGILVIKHVGIKPFSA